jgi:ParB-like chromosome segregation protein Spo0J
MSDGAEVRVEYMPLRGMVRATRNPKGHDLGEIMRSIKRFGFTSPVMVNERTGSLLAGHGRLDALQRMKARGDAVPMRVREDRGEWYIPVIRGVEFESDAEAEAYLVADNRLVEVGAWNEDELARVLSDLASAGAEMLNGTGYDVDDLDELLKRLGAEKGEEEVEEAREDEIKEQWSIIIECSNEFEQTDLLEELSERGLRVKALVA